MSPRSVLLFAGAAAVILAGHGSGAPASGWPGPGGHLLPPVPTDRLTQPFGCTALILEPAAAWCPSGHFHSGVDLAAAGGAPVVCAAGGVARVFLSRGGYGLHVIVDHGGGWSTLYAHLSVVSVADGQQVAAGSRLGLVGSTGLSTGPHLHFEVRSNGRPVDPAAYLPIHR